MNGERDFRHSLTWKNVYRPYTSQLPKPFANYATSIFRCDVTLVPFINIPVYAYFQIKKVKHLDTRRSNTIPWQQKVKHHTSTTEGQNTIPWQQKVKTPYLDNRTLHDGYILGRQTDWWNPFWKVGNFDPLCDFTGLKVVKGAQNASKHLMKSTESNREVTFRIEVNVAEGHGGFIKQ